MEGSSIFRKLEDSSLLRQLTDPLGMTTDTSQLACGVIYLMSNCVFCQIVDGKSPAQIVYEDENYLAFLDKYPQTRGHLQLIPKRHYHWVYDMPDLGNFFEVAQKIIRVIIPMLEADHVTLATFGHEVKHAHLWIVPQYKTHVQVSEGYKYKGEDDLVNLFKKALNSKIKNQKSKIKIKIQNDNVK